jgi:putative ABC transport system ATP-binding protein
VGLELREVVKHYRSGDEVVRAVDGVSLRIDAGEIVALYGPSGAGKSTLMLMGAGLLAPDEGRVTFDGGAVPTSGDERARYLRDTVGIVFQATHLVASASALDNAATKLLASGLSLAQARRQARPWIERVGLAERADHRPRQLSMGERQRVAIARALASRPRMLLADEPTASLDSVRGREIIELLRDVAHGERIPVLLVTHNPMAVTLVDRAHTLRDGHLRDGVDAELLGLATRG